MQIDYLLEKLNPTRSIKLTDHIALYYLQFTRNKQSKVKITELDIWRSLNLISGDLWTWYPCNATCGCLCCAITLSLYTPFLTLKAPKICHTHLPCMWDVAACLSLASLCIFKTYLKWSGPGLSLLVYSGKGLESLLASVSHPWHL